MKRSTAIPKRAEEVEDAAAKIQSERFIAKARELGLDEREETFDAALTKVARHKPSEASPSISSEHVTRRSADSE